MIEVEEELRRRQEAQLAVNAYHRVFESEDGKIVLADLEKHFQFSLPEFLGPDVNMGLVRSGQRRVKIHIDEQLAKPVLGDANLQPQAKVITE